MTGAPGSFEPGGPGRRFLTALADLIWPPVCAVCPRLLPLPKNSGRVGNNWAGDPAHDFCPECLATVEALPPSLCRLCGRPFYHSPEHVCGDCLAAPPPFRQARSAVVYGGAASRSIALMKYYGDLSQARPLAALAAGALTPLLNSRGGAEYDFILPLPISPARLRQRGFNQTVELAGQLFRPWRGLINEDLLARSSDGRAHQAGLSARRRRQAIKGCFTVPRPEAVLGKALLLFDDVYTTGATVYEAAGALMNAGAAFVDVVTIARTVMAQWR